MHSYKSADLGLRLVKCELLGLSPLDFSHVRKFQSYLVPCSLATKRFRAPWNGRSRLEGCCDLHCALPVGTMAVAEVILKVVSSFSSRVDSETKKDREEDPLF